MHEDAIIAEVARRMHVPVARLRARDRAPHVVAARYAACWALSRSGLTPARIGRVFGLHHSTVVHGLRRAEQHPEWRALVAPAVELSGAGGQRQALRRWLDRGLRGLVPGQRQAVRAYATCTLLAWERHSGATCAHGLWLVLSQPRARAALEEALRRSDLATTIGRIDVQAAHLGYRVR